MSPTVQEPEASQSRSQVPASPRAGVSQHPATPNTPNTPNTLTSTPNTSTPTTPVSPTPVTPVKSVTPVTPVTPDTPLEPRISRPSLVQGWYADDGQAAASLETLRCLWDRVSSHGPAYGFYPKPEDTVLIVKPRRFEEAVKLFENTGIQITCEGHRDLGGAIGSEKFVEAYASQRIEGWVDQIRCLADIARTQPHAAYSAFVLGVQQRWVHFQRSTACGPHLFQPLEDAICKDFIPALLGLEQGEAISEILRAVFSLPVSHGGLAIFNPVDECPHNHRDSRRLTKPMRKSMLGDQTLPDCDYRPLALQNKDLRNKRFDRLKARIIQLKPEMERILFFASEKGATNFWTNRPLEKFGLAMKCRQDFQDCVAMRYHLPIKGLPPTCACGEPFSFDHSQTCKLGGFVNMKHNEVRNTFADQAKRVFHDVECEPKLLPLLPGEELRRKSANVSDDARSDVRVRSFWRNWRNAFFDVMVFYPFAKSHFSVDPVTLYRRCEATKKRNYEERIRVVENADFTPLIMSSSGGMGVQMQSALKHLCRLIAEKTKQPYSKVIGVMRCKLAFQLMCSALVCLRGTRSRRSAARDPLEELDLAAAALL